MKTIKHTIQCHCVLPQFRKMEEPIFHKIPVFSIFDNDPTENSDGDIKEKIVQCENCGVVHRVIDVCKSEIVTGTDFADSIVRISELQSMIPASVIELLKKNNCHISIWEEVSYIYENDAWGSAVVISRDTKEKQIFYKILNIKDKDRFKVSSEVVSYGFDF